MFFDPSDIALLNRIECCAAGASAATMKLICGNGLHEDDKALSKGAGLFGYFPYSEHARRAALYSKKELPEAQIYLRLIINKNELSVDSLIN